MSRRKFRVAVLTGIWYNKKVTRMKEKEKKNDGS